MDSRRCADCNCELNEGEALAFTVCDACDDSQSPRSAGYANPVSQGVQNGGHDVSIVCTNNGGGLQPRTVSLPHQVTAEKIKELLEKYPDTKAITVIKASNKNYENVWLHNDWINYRKKSEDHIE